MKVIYDWSFGASGDCPTSPHPKRRHQGNTLARRTVRKTVKGFRGVPTPVTSYVDTVRCAHCGVTHEQEWMPA